jgi:outer membrane lipoprotein carrier protein
MNAQHRKVRERSRQGVLLLWLWLLAPLPLLAATPVQQLTELLDRIETFEAQVSQVIVEASGGVLEESVIVFRLKRPDGFYWETLDPWPELIVTDGESLWHYEPDLMQVSIEDWNPDQSELTAQLLSGRSVAITDDYEVSVHEASNETAREFTLIPLDPASAYDEVSIYFDDGMLSAMRILHVNGQRTLWQFYGQRLNAGIDDDVFQFDVPDDDFVDVFDNRQR